MRSDKMNWRSQLGRFRYQLLGALVVSVLVPVFIRWGGEFDDMLAPQQLNASIASGLAILFGLIGLRQIGSLPGTRDSIYLVPVMLVSFALVLLAMMFGRIEYNRYLFPTSFVLSVLWIFVSQSIAYRHIQPHFAIVPGGKADDAATIDGAKWSRLERPELRAVRRMNGVVADLREELSPEWERFIADCALAGIRVFHVKQIREALTGKVEIEHLSENTLGSLNPDALYLRVKQAIDWSAALAALVLLSPILLVVAILIRRDSPGPALFRQTRIGFRGRPFTVYKFRTMVADADRRGDKLTSAMTKADDPRITSLGRWLRKHRVDELPQLINILKGEMSWIGPRPEAEALGLWYEGELPYYRYRHIVRPGISGWAQVNQGHVHQVDDALEKLHYDFYYIKNFSPWLDILILLRTIRTMLTGFGAN